MSNGDNYEMNQNRIKEKKGKAFADPDPSIESSFSSAFKKFSVLTNPTYKPCVSNNNHLRNQTKLFQTRSTQTEIYLLLPKQEDVKNESNANTPPSPLLDNVLLPPPSPPSAYYYPPPWQQIHQNIQMRHPFSYMEKTCGWSVCLEYYQQN